MKKFSIVVSWVIGEGITFFETVNFPVSRHPGVCS